jgi:type IV pilus assembly protein PilM
LKSTLSIDIGSKNLHIVEGAYSKGKINVNQMQCFEVPKGCLNGEQVENPELLAETIKEAIRKANFSFSEVIFTINACNAVVRDIDLPSAKPKETENMIKSELIQTFNILPDDIIQFKEIEKVEGANGEKLNRYRATVISKDIINSYYKLIEATKVKAIALDINFNSIDKLLRISNNINDFPTKDEAIMLIDYGHTYSTVYISYNEDPVFYRHLTLGSGEIEKTLYEETRLPIEEFLRMKEDGAEFMNEEGNSSRYYATLKPYFHKFNDEIRKIISFYNSRTSTSQVSRIYLFGNGSELEGLTEYFSKKLNANVELIKKVSSISINKSESVLHGYINAIGTLIRL